VDVKTPVEDNSESEDEPHCNDNDDSDDFQFNDADEDDDSVSVFQLLPDGENELWEADIGSVEPTIYIQEGQKKYCNERFT
jgi:hypothetical protein